MSDMPMYEVVEKTFIQPYLLQPGSVISTHAPPSKSLRPLNDPAKDRMEAYYNKEYKTKDEYGQPVTLKPNEGYRPPTEEQISEQQHTVRLHALPPQDSTGKADLEVLARPLQPDLIPTGLMTPVEPDPDADPDAPVVHKSAPAPKLKA